MSSLSSSHGALGEPVPCNTRAAGCGRLPRIEDPRQGSDQEWRRQRFPPSGILYCCQTQFDRTGCLVILMADDGHGQSGSGKSPSEPTFGQGEAGEEVIITRHGRAVASLGPVSRPRSSLWRDPAAPPSSRGRSRHRRKDVLKDVLRRIHRKDHGCKRHSVPRRVRGPPCLDRSHQHDAVRVDAGDRYDLQLFSVDPGNDLRQSFSVLR